MQSKTIIYPSFVDAQATGVKEAGNYREYAEKHGYKFIEVLNWSSSAGDWEFIISKDGKEWQILSQTNNFPRAGFSYHIDSELFYGTADEVLKQIVEMY